MTIDEYLTRQDAETANALAAALRIPPPLLSRWRCGVRPVPPERCIEIERVTGGAVRCEDLRPDIDWSVVRGTACPPAPKPSRGDTAATAEA